MPRESLNSWPNGLPFAVPLTQNLDPGRDGMVPEALRNCPQVAGTVIEALMWLRLGRFQPAHEIVQDATHGISAYVHGMLHRIDGDYGNANYWFRQTRDSGLEKRIIRSMSIRGEWQPWDGDFDPSLFTRACERWHQDPSKCKGWSEEDLQTLALIEWEAVWENALNSLS